MKVDEMKLVEWSSPVDQKTWTKRLSVRPPVLPSWNLGQVHMVMLTMVTMTVHACRSFHAFE